jgi:hypothetical protein
VQMRIELEVTNMHSPISILCVLLVQWLLRGGGLLKRSVLETGHLGRGGAPSDIALGAVGGMAYCESFMSIGIRHSMFFSAS